MTSPAESREERAAFEYAVAPRVAVDSWSDQRSDYARAEREVATRQGAIAVVDEWTAQHLHAMSSVRTTPRAEIQHVPESRIASVFRPASALERRPPNITSESDVEATFRAGGTLRLSSLRSDAETRYTGRTRQGESRSEAAFPLSEASNYVGESRSEATVQRVRAPTTSSVSRTAVTFQRVEAPRISDVPRLEVASQNVGGPSYASEQDPTAASRTVRTSANANELRPDVTTRHIGAPSSVYGASGPDAASQIVGGPNYASEARGGTAFRRVGMQSDAYTSRPTAALQYTGAPIVMDVQRHAERNVGAQRFASELRSAPELPRDATQPRDGAAFQSDRAQSEAHGSRSVDTFQLGQTRNATREARPTEIQSARVPSHASEWRDGSASQRLEVLSATHALRPAAAVQPLRSVSAESEAWLEPAFQNIETPTSTNHLRVGAQNFGTTRAVNEPLHEPFSQSFGFSEMVVGQEASEINSQRSTELRNAAESHPGEACRTFAAPTADTVFQASAESRGAAFHNIGTPGIDRPASEVAFQRSTELRDSAESQSGAAFRTSNAPRVDPVSQSDAAFSGSAFQNVGVSRIYRPASEVASQRSTEPRDAFDLQSREAFRTLAAQRASQVFQSEAETRESAFQNDRASRMDRPVSEVVFRRSNDLRDAADSQSGAAFQTFVAPRVDPAFQSEAEFRRPAFQNGQASRIGRPASEVALQRSTQSELAFQIPITQRDDPGFQSEAEYRRPAFRNYSSPMVVSAASEAASQHPVEPIEVAGSQSEAASWMFDTRQVDMDYRSEAEFRTAATPSVIANLQEARFQNVTVRKRNTRGVDHTLSVGRAPERPPDLTRDGADGHFSLLVSKWTRVGHRLGRQIDLLRQTLESNNAHLITQEMSHVDKLLQELIDISRAFGLSGGEELAQDFIHKTAMLEDETFEVKSAACHRLKFIEEEGSVASRSSGGSRKSRRTNRSNQSRISRASIQNKAEVAGLAARLEVLKASGDRRIEEEVSRTRRRKRDELQQRIEALESEINAAEAKQCVLDETRVNEDTPLHDEYMSMQEYKRPAQGRGDRPAATQPQISCDRSADATHPTDTVASSIAKMLAISAAPAADIDVFSGNILEYEYFKATFKEAVEANVFDQRSRLTRLIKFTAGEPKELIKEYVHADPEHCFDLAVAALDKQYGDEDRLHAAYLKELREWPAIRSSDAVAYRKIHRFLTKCQISKSKGNLQLLDSAEIIRTILSKFQQNVQEAWNKSASLLKEREQRRAVFNDLVSFIERQTNLLNNPEYSRAAFTGNKDRTSSMKAFATGVTADGEQQSRAKSWSCRLCQGNHQLEKCLQFETLDVDGRLEVLKTNRLCFGCFRSTNPNHYSKVCGSKPKCELCGDKHQTLLHGSITVAAVQRPDTQSRISLSVMQVFVSHESNPNHRVKVYAMLDPCSQGTFIEEALLEQLGLHHGQDSKLTLKTINGEQTIDSHSVKGLRVEGNGARNRHTVDLPVTYTQPELPFGEEDIPTFSKLKDWSQFDKIAKELPVCDSNVPFGLLIGANCVKALEPLQIIPSTLNGPYAVLTRLGWCVVGPMHGERATKLKCNLVKNSLCTQDVCSGEVKSSHRLIYNDVKDHSISEALQSMYNLEFVERNGESVAPSIEDDRFMKLMRDEVKMENGHYVLPLPFRSEDINMPDNHGQAVRRCNGIKKRMLKDEGYRLDYAKFMQNLLDKGYAVESNERPSGRTWYLPHHGLYQKGKFRVVFDAAAKFQGTSLNNCLIPGPDLTSNLVGVLIRFRKEVVPFVADIESMFYQVSVPEHQQSFLQFLWWPGGDMSAEMQAYKMKVHIFGAVSSPGCANFALRQTASDHRHLSEAASETLAANFYVDDLLKSVQNNKVASRLAVKTREMCSAGGFNLTKFSAIDTEVLSGIPAEAIAPPSARREVGEETVERALGVSWNLQSDSFCLRMDFNDSPLTRRGVLSTVSAIYDPLGLASPFLLRARLILQEITKDGKGWDDPLSDHQRAAWEKWRLSITHLSVIEVRRAYKTEGSPVKDVSIHCFSDASDSGYGAAVYLRTAYEDNRVDSSLVIGKSRVAPTKRITTPRLELVGATVSARLSELVSRELMMTPQPKVHFWVDSEIVLGYIKNESKRFKTFVANRVRAVRDKSEPQQWDYVSTNENPADYASRGIKPEDEAKMEQWLHGPEFLLQQEVTQPQVTPSVPDDDPEVQQVTKVLSASVIEPTLDEELCNRISSYHKIKRVVATLMKFADLCRKKTATAEIMVEDLDRAEKTLIALAQKRMLKDNPIYSATRKSGKGKDSLRLWKLNPYQDQDGLLRVGGRLNLASLDQKNPYILAKASALSKRIAEEAHRRVQHSGRTTTVAELRACGFWIVGCTRLVKEIVHRCVTCRKGRGALQDQQMADLPSERVEAIGPFSYCGLDMFGPFTTTLARKSFKRYVALFICLASKAVHLEVTYDMSTDSFISALRRFICRRGCVRSIRCDNGTNFVGARNELQKEMEAFDKEKIERFLSERSCDIEWKHNPPKSSHMGGVWERAIRSARSIITTILTEHRRSLNDEMLATFLCEVESTMNCRPICPENVSDPSIPVLTPNHILTMKTEVVPAPPGMFTSADEYCRKRWRVVQRLAEMFWSRWKREYVRSLQERTKWNGKKRNLAVGDVVLMKEEDVPRNKWPLGVVRHAIVSEDGLVRTVEVQMTSSKGTLKRPAAKAVLLVETDRVSGEECDGFVKFPLQ